MSALQYQNLMELYHQINAIRSAFESICKAVKEKNLEGVKNVLNKEGSEIVNQIDNSGKTVLHLSAEEGELAISKYLIDETKIHINIIDNHRRTALHYACEISASKEEQKLKIAELLLTKGAVVSQDIEGDTPLHVLSKRVFINAAKYLDLLVLMIAAGMDINTPNNTLQTPLHLAAATNEQNVLFLMKRGANPNIVDRNKETPLHVALRLGRVTTAKLLVRMGADPFRVGPDGTTSYDYALRAQFNDLVAVMTNSPASMSTQSYKNFQEQLKSIH